MFVPQAIMAIVASLLGAGLRAASAPSASICWGCWPTCSAMTLLVVEPLCRYRTFLAYAILLVATSCMGVGFGFTVPALNTLAAAFFPAEGGQGRARSERAPGIGNGAGSGLCRALCRTRNLVGPAVLVGLLLFGLLVLSARESLNEAESSHVGRIQKGKFPMRFWMFAAFVLLYGVCETMNGNWASLYLTKHFGRAQPLASLALTVFWSMVTAGRVLFACLEKWFPQRLVCRALPFVVTAAFITGAWVPKIIRSLAF